MSILATARKLRPIIEQAMASVDDATASRSAQLFPTLKKDGKLIAAGTRINWNGTVMRAAVDLWDTDGNDPESAPTLWDAIGYKDGYRIIPEVITAGTAFSQGEYGWWNDELYISLIDSNVWTPEAYPASWEKAEQ